MNPKKCIIHGYLDNGISILQLHEQGQQHRSFLITYFHLLRILADVRNVVLFDLIAFPTCDPQDQIVQRRPAQDIHVITSDEC